MDMSAMAGLATDLELNWNKTHYGYRHVDGTWAIEVGLGKQVSLHSIAAHGSIHHVLDAELHTALDYTTR